GRETGEIPDLRVMPETLGLGGAAQEQHRSVESLRANPAGGEEQGVESALAMGAERLRRDRDVLVAGGRPRGLAVHLRPPAPQDAPLPADGALDQASHLEIGRDRNLALEVGDPPDVPEAVRAPPHGIAGASDERAKRALLDGEGIAPDRLHLAKTATGEP